MSECTCHKNYTLDTLIPQVGVITDIHEETPDVKTFCVTAPDGGKLFRAYAGTVRNGLRTRRKRGYVFHYFFSYKQRVSGIQY